MVTEGHQFCNSDSLTLMQLAFPDVIQNLENRDEVNEGVPEEEDGAAESSPSGAE